MSYIRYCDKCGLKISLRQMSHGRYVAFDAGTDTPHKHGKKNSDWTGDEDDLLQEYYEDGKSIEEICKLLNRNEQFVINKLNKLGLDRPNDKPHTKIHYPPKRKSHYPKGDFTTCSKCNGKGLIETKLIKSVSFYECGNCLGSGYEKIEEILTDKVEKDQLNDPIIIDHEPIRIKESKVDKQSTEKKSNFEKEKKNSSPYLYIFIFLVIIFIYLKVFA